MRTFSHPLHSGSLFLLFWLPLLPRCAPPPCLLCSPLSLLVWLPCSVCLCCSSPCLLALPGALVAHPLLSHLPAPPYEDFTSPYDVDCPVRGWLVMALLPPPSRAPPGAVLAGWGGMVPELTLASLNPMAAGCKGNSVPEAAGCGCCGTCGCALAARLSPGPWSPSPLHHRDTPPAGSFQMRPKSLPETAACAASCMPEAAGCRQNPCQSLSSTLDGA